MTSTDKKIDHDESCPHPCILLDAKSDDSEKMNVDAVVAELVVVVVEQIEWWWLEEMLDICCFQCNNRLLVRRTIIR
jgi:hypothetical protein